MAGTVPPADRPGPLRRVARPTTYGEPMNSSMVDWDLAVTTGTPAGQPRPDGHSRRGPRGRRPAARPSPSRRTATSRPSPAWTPPTDGASVAVIDRPGWIQANAAGFRTVLEPLDREDPGDAAAVIARRPTAVGSQVTGVADRLAAGLPGDQGARPVRAVPAVRRGRRDHAGPAAARRAEHRGRRARDGRRPARLPALGVPARGDPPGAVRRGAVAARAHDGRDPRLRRGDRRRPGGAARERLEAAAAAAYGAVRDGFDPDAPRAARSSRPCRPRRSARSSTGSPR